MVRVVVKVCQCEQGPGGAELTSARIPAKMHYAESSLANLLADLVVRDALWLGSDIRQQEQPAARLHLGWCGLQIPGALRVAGCIRLPEWQVEQHCTEWRSILPVAEEAGALRLGPEASCKEFCRRVHVCVRTKEGGCYLTMLKLRLRVPCEFLQVQSSACSRSIRPGFQTGRDLQRGAPGTLERLVGMTASLGQQRSVQAPMTTHPQPGRPER